MKKIIARLVAATERIRSVVQEEATISRTQGLGVAADELDLLAMEIEQKREEYQAGLKLVSTTPPKTSVTRIVGKIAASAPLSFGVCKMLTEWVQHFDGMVT